MMTNQGTRQRAIYTETATARLRNSVVGTLPQYELESSIATKLGERLERGPQQASILLQIVIRRE